MGSSPSLSAVFTQAVRDEAVQGNPVTRLKGSLPPAKAKTKARVLTVEEIGKLIDSAPKRFVTLIATACFTGLRQSELLGLRWGDIDFDENRLHVRNQLSRATRERPAMLVPLKTDAAERSIDLAPDLAKELRRHLLAAKPEHSTPESFVFSTEIGTPMYYRNVNTRALDKAADKAGPEPRGHAEALLPRPPALGHLHLIRAGVDPVTVSRFAGHSKTSVTLDVYAHEFQNRKDEGAGAALAAALGGVL